MPAEQLYLSFFCLFSLHKVLKLCCEVKKNHARGTVILTKNKYISMSIWASLIEIDIWALPYLLNNFTYASYACFAWPKCWNYVIKLKKPRAWHSNFNKDKYISMNIWASLIKIDIWVLPYLLSNFT